jgi:hypothetical protein
MTIIARFTRLGKAVTGGRDMKKLSLLIIAILLVIACSLTANDGSCVSGDCMNGKGTMSYANGNSYAGEFRNGVPHGLGKMTFALGGNYEGEFSEGKPNGRGTLLLPNGNIYVGQFQDFLMHGQGTFSYKDGRKYVGEFRESKRHGLGTLYKSDGSVDKQGRWEDGAFVGK